MEFDNETDERLRSAGFAFLRALELRTGGPARFEDLAQFEFEGRRIPLMDRQRGIRSPRDMETALSFRTPYASRPDLRPYDDLPGPDGYLRYKWRGTNAQQAENRAMRLSFQRHLPMIWFHGIEQGTYLPLYPVWAVSEEPEQHQFVIALDQIQVERWKHGTPIETDMDREYAEQISRRRLHQPLFRARVLAAYETRCSICRLQHSELLDAAHIKSDSEGGEPIVPNGLSLCKIHHAAYDADIVGIDPDYQVVVRDDVRDESDGPTLRHTIQAVHNSSLTVPRRRKAQPDRDLLAERFESFLAAS